MLSINVMPVGKRSKERILIEIMTVHTLLAYSLAANSLVVQIGKMGFQ